MNALVYAVLSAGCAALANLIFRKSTDSASSNSSSNGYLLLFFFFSFVFSLIVFPEVWSAKVNYLILALGGVIGLLNSCLMILMSKTLKKGPAGLTFAFQNASAVFPGLLLFLALGTNFGFSCSYYQMMGMVLVLAGLFIGAKDESTDNTKASSTWLKYAMTCFTIQVLALTLIQARCILFKDTGTAGFLANFAITEADDVWFMPGQFGTSLLIQSALFLREKKRLQLKEAFYGSLGGISNCASTFLLLISTKIALPSEKSILFPCFAVTTIILCNLWANKIYKEKFNLKTNVICSLGIFLAVLA